MAKPNLTPTQWGAIRGHLWELARDVLRNGDRPEDLDALAIATQLQQRCARVSGLKSQSTLWWQALDRETRSMLIAAARGVRAERTRLGREVVR